MKKIILVLIAFFFIVPSAHAVKSWAEIYSSKVVGIHLMPDDLIPVFRPSSFRIAVNVTGLEPMPTVGWGYNINTGEFSPPAIVYFRVITSKAFFQRLLPQEMENLVTSADAKVVWFRYWLALSGDVNLSDPQIISAVNMLETKGIIGVDRASIILEIEHS